MSFSTIFPQKTPFPPTCAIFAPLPVTLIVDWRWSVDYLTDVGFPHHVPHRIFFISMSFSTVFTQKTPFPPTGAILAPLPVTLIVNWRWSVDYPTDVGFPHHVPHRFFSFPCIFLRFFLKNRHFRQIAPFLRHLQWRPVIGADHQTISKT